MRFCLQALIFLALIVAVGARADLLRVPYEGVRPTGMGNAFIALADDSNVLWYNPAALTQVQGIHLNLFDFTLGVDSTDTFSRIKNALFKSDYNDLIRSGPEFLGFAVRPSLITKYFGVSLYNNLHSYTNLDLSSLTGHVDAYSFNDVGIIGGFGVPVTDYFSMGVSARVVEHSAIDLSLSFQDLLNIAASNQSDFQNAIYQHLQQMMGTGWGVGLTVGTLLRVPLPSGYPRWQIGATIEDLGETTYHKLGSLPLPPPTKPAYNFGTSLQYTLGHDSKLNLAMDMRNNFEGNPFYESFHLGVEYRYKFLGLRGGFYDGYPTYGFSIEAPPHTKIHFSSYEVETGDHLYAQGQRFYMLQLEIGFNPL